MKSLNDYFYFGSLMYILLLYFHCNGAFLKCGVATSIERVLMTLKALMLWQSEDKDNLLMSTQKIKHSRGHFSHISPRFSS